MKRRTIFSLALASIAMFGGMTGIKLASIPDAPVVKIQAPKPPVPVEIPPAPVAPIRANNPGFRSNLEKATNPLYADINGNVRFICTATAIQKLPTGYVFLTARHCVQGISGIRAWYVVIDKDSDTPFIKATVLIAGGADTDAALLQVNTPISLPVIPIGDERLVSEGSRVEYFGFPMNLGKLFFEGYVSTKKIGPPAYTEPQWNGDLGITIQIAPGSSGSALVDPNQEAIVGVVTGVTVSPFGGAVLGLATPASKVRTLVNDYKTGRIRIQSDPFESMLNKYFRPH